MDRGTLIARSHPQDQPAAAQGHEPGHAGVPLYFIAKLGGWKKLEVLKKYLLSSGLDVAKVVAEYDFFR